MQTAIQAIVTIQNDQLTTTSKNIADVFGKQHRDVLKAIDNLLPDLPAEWGMRNFAQGYYTMPETAEQQHRMFTITRDGFTLLAMGFTGKKALEFKLAYIDQFNAMQKVLTQPVPIGAPERLTLTPEQQRFVQKAVNAKVKATGEHWNTIYHNIKDVFNVGTYTDIKQETFPALCEYLGVVYTGEFIAATNAPKAIEAPTTVPSIAPDFKIERDSNWHVNFQQGQESVNAIRLSVCTGDAKRLDQVKYALRNAQSKIYNIDFCADGISTGYIDMVSRYAIVGMQACQAPLVANRI